MTAILRRSGPRNRVEVKGLVWNEEQFDITFENKQIKLTSKEFTLLGHFMKHPNQVLAREQLIELIWGFASGTEDRTVDSHVRNMRDKIHQADFPID